MSEEVTLKPCPFCGREAEINECVCDYGPDETHYVGCIHCGVSTDFATADAAITTWNRRTPEPGTSVVRWVKYDGTPETLPESNVIDASYALCLASIGGGGSPVQSVLFHSKRVSWGYVCGLEEEINDFAVEVGDVWCYWTGLPAPPEEANE